MDEGKNAQEMIFELDSFCTFLIVIGALIAIYINEQKKKMMILDIIDRRVEKALGRLSEDSILLILIATTFFVYETYKNYINKRTKATLVFFGAAALVFVAIIMRYYVIRRTNGLAVEGSQDII